MGKLLAFIRDHFEEDWVVEMQMLRMMSGRTSIDKDLILANIVDKMRKMSTLV